MDMHWQFRGPWRPIDPATEWMFEVTQDPEELPDDQIVPDDTEPLPPEPEVKTDPVDDE